MKIQPNDKHKKISYDLQDQFKNLRNIFHSNEQKNQFDSGSDGIFDIIQKFNIDPTHGAKSTIGIRIKNDDKQEYGKINFYVVRRMIEKPLFAVSKDLTYDELKNILNKMSLVDTENSVIEVLNKLKLFDFNLNVLILSKNEFEKLLFELKIETDNCFKCLEANLINPYHESIKNNGVAENSLEIEKEKLIKNEEYQKLLKEKSELDLKISQLEKEFNNAKITAKIEKQKLDILSGFMKDREKILEKKENDLLNDLANRKKMKDLIIDVTYYQAVQSVFNWGDDFPKTKEKPEFFTFETVDKMVNK